MKGEACALRGGSVQEAKAPREDEVQLPNASDVCRPCGACHRPCPCWRVVLPHTLGMSPPAPCCRGCASLPPLREAVPAHPPPAQAQAHSRGEKQCLAHCRLPGEPRRLAGVIR